MRNQRIPSTKVQIRRRTSHIDIDWTRKVPSTPADPLIVRLKTKNPPKRRSLAVKAKHQKMQNQKKISPKIVQMMKNRGTALKMRKAPERVEVDLQAGIKKKGRNDHVQEIKAVQKLRGKDLVVH